MNTKKLQTTLKTPSCASGLYNGSLCYYYRSGCYDDGGEYVLISANFCSKCGQYKKPHILQLLLDAFVG